MAIEPQQLCELRSQLITDPDLVEAIMGRPGIFQPTPEFKP
jgi:hypothetical protein